MMAATPRHVIFGTGAIGLATFEALRRRGERVRLVNRSGTAPVPDDIEILAGDASDPAFATTAAQAAGARLVSMENVHVRAPQRPAPHRDPPLCRPHQEREAARPHGPRATRRPCGRQRPGGHRPGLGLLRPPRRRPSNLGDRVIPAALAGKTAMVLGDPDQPHTYTYIPDIGEGLATLGEHPDAPGEVWHLPNDPHTRTTRQLVDAIYQLAGQPKAKLRGTPVLLLRALGVINPTVRELVELQYEFQEPFVVDSTKIAAKLDVHATPLDQALADTLASYRIPNPAA
jgi:nucleoside-diphosphate-sugar epimerase